jgi:hypothetical protein
LGGQKKRAIADLAAIWVMVSIGPAAVAASGVSCRALRCGPERSRREATFFFPDFALALDFFLEAVLDFDLDFDLDLDLDLDFATDFFAFAFALDLDFDFLAIAISPSQLLAAINNNSAGEA